MGTVNSHEVTDNVNGIIKNNIEKRLNTSYKNIQDIIKLDLEIINLEKQENKTTKSEEEQIKIKIKKNIEKEKIAKSMNDNFKKDICTNNKIKRYLWNK